MPIDNAATGHAARAVQAVTDAMPHLGDKDAFYQRVRNGYQLNSLGAGTTQIIADFDIEQEVIDIFATKAVTGSQLHSDYCRIGGKTGNEWLAAPNQIQHFIAALEKTGWIRRHESPDNNGFWNLLVGEKGAMFGVFNAYELQVIYDWIAGDSAQILTKRQTSYRNLKQHFDGLRQDPCQARSSSISHENQAFNNEFTMECTLLNDSLAKAPDKSAAMDLLTPWLSPVYHYTSVGLMATRIFTKGLRA